MKSLVVLSLFDGISCGRIALDQLDIPIKRYLASEIKPHAIKIAMKNYPDSIQIGDVNDIDFTKLVGKIDLLIGGFPYQDLSCANVKGRGLKGERSGLFYKFVEALEVVKPKYFLCENNASMTNDARDIITKTFRVKPLLIDSADFSAQTRRRLYWTNIPRNKKKITKSTQVIKDIIDPNCTNNIRSFEEYKDNLRVNKESGSISWDNGTGHWSQCFRCRSPKYKMCTLMSTTRAGLNIYLGNYKFRCISPLEAERLQTLPDNYTEGISKTQRLSVCGDGWTVEVIKYLLEPLRECF